MDLLLGKTIYYKRTKANGQSSIQGARVWDEKKFMKSLKSKAEIQAMKEGVKPDVIELSTREAYRNAHHTKD